MTLSVRLTDVGIGIPYPCIPREDRDSNHGYVDLKKSPERIRDIPEFRDCVELFGFVEALNHPQSAFRTLGCAYHGTRCYVHIAFEVLHWNTSRQNYLRLFRGYSKYLEMRGTVAGVSTEFRICPASFWDHGFDGWAASIHFDLLGRIENDESLRAAIVSFQHFLQSESEGLQDQLRLCARRIS